MVKKNFIFVKFIYNYKPSQEKLKNKKLLIIKILLYINLMLFFFDKSKFELIFFKKRFSISNINRAPYRFKTSRHQLTLIRRSLSLKFSFDLNFHLKNFKFLDFLMFLNKISGALVYLSAAGLFLNYKNLEWASAI